MNRLLKPHWFLLFLSAVWPFAASAERKELSYPNSVNRLFIETDDIESQQKLARRVGFDLNRQYAYLEYADTKRENKLGYEGGWKDLMLSTGGSDWDINASLKAYDQPCYWAMTYYGSHDVTIIHEECFDSPHNDSSRHTSFVRILKLGEGENLNLHLE